MNRYDDHHSEGCATPLAQAKVIMRSYTLKKHLLIVILFAALVVALSMTGVLPETPPLISN